MDDILKQMLKHYKVDTIEEQKNALKEILQEVILSALSRSGFFKEAAFYGGTALRIFYGLDRFSEDLDFSLLKKDENFSLEKYFSFIEAELTSLGLHFEVAMKDKSTNSHIQSAFLKGNTKEHIFTIFHQDDQHLHRDEVIKIKFEIDTLPPIGAHTEFKYGLLPYPYSVQIYDLPSLFAGKIHALLCRNWKSRVKGRDFYDFIFFLSLGTPVNLAHLKARLLDSHFSLNDEDFTIEYVKDLLKERFLDIDYEQAKMDVLPFIKDPHKLDLWNANFFIEISKNLKDSN